MNSVVILASGNGKRAKSNIPKQYIKINKRRIIDYSVKTFSNNKLIEEIILVVNKNWVKTIKDEYKNCIVVSGGKTRSESSFNGIKNCRKGCSKVLIHDAARPLINQTIINNCIKYIGKYDCVIPVLSVVDSIINEKNKYLNRKDLKILQTPQCFNYNNLFKAYNKTKLNFPDDLSVFLNFNSDFKIKYIQGTKKNFKITLKDDIELMEKISEG